MTDVDVSVDASFLPCPTAQAVGIPLVVKRVPGPGVPSDCHLCVRFMTDPKRGMAPLDWQYGGCLPHAPPVLAARTDGVPFSSNGWRALDDFIMDTFDEGPRQVDHETFLRFLRRENGKAFEPFDDVSRSLHLRFPEGMPVKPMGLKKAAELNNVEGTVAGRYENGRVGVSFPGQVGVKALQPQSLFTLDGRPADLDHKNLAGHADGSGSSEDSYEKMPGSGVDDGDGNFYASMWQDFDGLGQPNDVPAGTTQHCYWTDGVDICRTKQTDGSWKYRCEHE